MAASGVCPFVMNTSLVLHTLLTVLLISLQCLQGIVLDVYLIAASTPSHFSFFWLVSDILVMFMFGITMCRSYMFWKKDSGKSCKRKSKIKQVNSERRKSLLVTHKSWLGNQPLSYGAWLMYSGVLVVKVAVIFHNEIIRSPWEESYLGAHLMTLTLGATSVVFLLFVEGHHDAVRDSRRAIYIASLVKDTFLEIFDSVGLLSLLYPSNPGWFLSYALQNVIIMFSCVNLLLPNLCLYRFSIDNFGKEKRDVSLSLTYRLCHLLLVNIPFMLIRLYCWIGLGQDISIFVVKNITHIILVLLELRPDFKMMWRNMTKSSSRTEKNDSNTSISSADIFLDTVSFESSKGHVVVELAPKETPQNGSTNGRVV